MSSTVVALRPTSQRLVSAAGIVAWVNSTWINLKEIDEDYFKRAGHKVSAGVGRSDLGWVLKYFSCLGPPFFLECLVGPPNKIQIKFVC